MHTTAPNISTPKNTPQSTQSLARSTTGAAIALLIICFVWEAFAAPARPVTAGFNWLAFKGFLLLPLLPKFWRQERRAYQILSLLILLYLTEGCMRAYADITLLSRMFAWTEIILSCYLFYTANRFAQLTRRQATQDTSNKKPRKPRPTGIKQVFAYSYASLLLLSIMGWMYPTDGSEGLIAQRTLQAIYLSFIALNLYLITTLILNGRKRAQANRTANPTTNPNSSTLQTHQLPQDSDHHA